MKLVVKRTFLEFVDSEAEEETVRPRGLSDCSFFIDFNDKASSRSSSKATSLPDSPALSDIADDMDSPAEDLLGAAESPWSSPCSTPLWEPRAAFLPRETVVPQLELPPCQPVPSTERFELQGMQAVSLVPVGTYANCWSTVKIVQPPPGCWSGMTDITKSASSSDARTNSAKIKALANETACATCEIAEELRTTVMLRPLPRSLTRDGLVELLDTEGYSGEFDFVYLPIDFASETSLCYAFVNMTTPAAARSLWAKFNGFCKWGTPSDEICTVTWSSPHQGLSAHVQRYRDSPIMHPAVPEIWKPLLFVNGQRAEFPTPTKKLKAPKFKHRSA